MRTVRRIAFAAPLVVVVACQRPAPQHPDEDEEEAEDDNALPPNVATPRPPADAAEPDAWRAPKQLVDQLKPLTSDRTIEDVCRHARCNPPPPYPPSKPAAVEIKTVYVEAMAREGTGTRVRLSRGDLRADSSWRAVFVSEAGNDLAGGECTIVRWDFHQLECTTELPPEQLTGRWEPLNARLIPPPGLAERVERARASWVDPVSKDSPAHTRVIAVSVSGSKTLVTLGIGTANGVAYDHVVTLVDDNDRPVRDGTCTIFKVTPRMTICTTALTPDQLKASPKALVGPRR